MDPREFITLGIKIIEDKQYFQEVRYRTAVGRIYYGLLHHIRIIKQIFNVDIDKFHTDLINKINDLDTVLGNLLGNMKELRNDADYNIESDFEKKKLNIFLGFFERVKKKIEL